MFFASKTIEALIKDHRKIRREVKVLKETSLSFIDRRNSFERLVPNLISYTQREEKVIYAYMLSSGDEELKLMAFDGEEEHKVLGQLVAEMRSGLSSQDEWSAQSLILVDLIEYHLDEAESDIFLCLKNFLDSDMDKELCRRYENIENSRMSNQVLGKNNMYQNRNIEMASEFNSQNRHY